ncbi:hypothetical protein CLOM_g5289, partial [Closterium sp. NIES-68]
MASTVLPPAFTASLASRCASVRQLSASARSAIQPRRTPPIRLVTAALGGGPGDIGAGGNLGAPVPVASLSSPSPSRVRPAFALASEATEGGAAATSGAAKATRVEVPTETDARGLTRMVLQEEGYEQWEWQGNKVNYVVAGDVSSDATPVLFIHGFGASVYHWRYNIPELAASGRPVYAIDL